MSVLHRRHPALVCYWTDGQLLAENYATRTRVEVTPLLLDILTALETWQPREALAARFERIPPALLGELLDSLAAHHLIEMTTVAGDAASSPGPAPDEADSMAVSWRGWMPSAAFLHFGTKDVPFTPRLKTMRQLKARAIADPPPPPLKAEPPPDVPRVALPEPIAPESIAPESIAPGSIASGSITSGARASRSMASATLVDALRERRTWRRFGARALTRQEIGTLLGLTWRVQDWIEVGAWGRMALKTAPSGGARHSIEAYLLARRVTGVAPGLYHYAPDAHELRLVRPGASSADIAAWLPRQDFYGEASALVLMTAVFPRAQWRYPFARAYRTVLAEAGHHCQTFCLVATSLRLAPFCTMALADTKIERALGVDGVTESVLYAAGVGPRPAGTAWAPWPDTTATPARTPNAPRTPSTTSGARPRKRAGARRRAR